MKWSLSKVAGVLTERPSQECLTKPRIVNSKTNCAVKFVRPPTI